MLPVHVPRWAGRDLSQAGRQNAAKLCTMHCVVVGVSCTQYYGVIIPVNGFYLARIPFIHPALCLSIEYCHIGDILSLFVYPVGYFCFSPS